MTKWFPQLLLIAGPLGFAGCEYNTKLGWPAISWNGGFWPVVAFMMTVAMLTGTIRLAFITSNTTSRSRDAIAGAVAMLAVAGILLQLLPTTDDGFQLIPLSPWSYTGWFSVVLSFVVWLFLVISVFVASSDSPDSATTFSALLLMAMVGNLLLSFSECERTSTVEAIASENDTSEKPVDSSFQTEIESWKARASRLRGLLQELLADRNQVLREVGRFSSSPTHRLAKTELLKEQDELAQQIDTVASELAAMDQAILRAESRLRRLARHSAINDVSNVSDTDFETMARIQHELEDELRSLRSRDSFSLAGLLLSNGEQP